MRENIGIFRGKDTIEHKWRYGNLTVHGDTAQIWEDTEQGLVNYLVDPGTVGEFTGLTDKNGTKIFEGDILQGDEYPYCSDGNYNYYAEVVCFDDGCCGFGLCTHKNPKSAVRGISDGYCEWFENFDSNNWSVIGNIHDNPELLIAGKANT